MQAVFTAFVFTEFAFSFNLITPGTLFHITPQNKVAPFIGAVRKRNGESSRIRGDWLTKYSAIPNSTYNISFNRSFVNNIISACIVARRGNNHAALRRRKVWVNEMQITLEQLLVFALAGGGIAIWLDKIPAWKNWTSQWKVWIVLAIGVVGQFLLPAILAAIPAGILNQSLEALVVGAFTAAAAFVVHELDKFLKLINKSK